jgi:hypothetical protein
MHNNVLYRCRSQLHLPAQQIFAPIDMQQYTDTVHYKGHRH